MGSGKYCGNRLPAVTITTSNYASVKYKGFKNIKGFKLEFTELSQECGGQLTLTQFANSTILQSPNFPEIPQPHTECTWTILGVPGEKIRIDFLFLDVTRSTDCRSEYVEIRDGGTSNSILIDRYCQDLPSSIYTTDNVAYLKFFTDVEDPRSGFKARISIANCGGTLRGKSGIISYSPNIDSGTNNDCTWHIIGPIDHTILLHFDKLHITCQQGYISISEFNQINETENEVKRFCEETTDFTTSNNKVSLRYHPLLSNTQTTFSISFNATQDRMYSVFLLFFFGIQRSVYF